MAFTDASGRLDAPPLKYFFFSISCSYLVKWPKWCSAFGVFVAEYPHALHQLVIWPNFCQRLHENEGNWTEGGYASLVPPVDPPME